MRSTSDPTTHAQMNIVPEHNETDKQKKRKTLELSNKLKSSKILKMDNVEHGYKNDTEKKKTLGTDR